MTLAYAAKLVEGVDLLAHALLRTKKTGGCEIPPPCWYPLSGGERCSHACPGATATLRVRVANSGPTSRLIRLEAPSGVTVAPDKLQLGPMARGHATLTFTMPADAVCGEDFEQVVWIRGCQAHYVRWTIVAAEKDSALSCELDVDDRPDYLHHWYDHFYCAHPCQGAAGKA